MEVKKTLIAVSGRKMNFSTCYSPLLVVKCFCSVVVVVVVVVVVPHTFKKHLQLTPAKFDRRNWSNLAGVKLIRRPLKCDFLTFIEFVQHMPRIWWLKKERKKGRLNRIRFRFLGALLECVCTLRCKQWCNNNTKKSFYLYRPRVCHIQCLHFRNIKNKSPT